MTRKNYWNDCKDFKLDILIVYHIPNSWMIEFIIFIPFRIYKFLYRMNYHSQ